MNITITVDTAANAAYIRLSDAPVARTVAHSEDINIDLDEYGIEVLDEGTPLPFQDLIEKFHVHSDVVDLLRLVRPDVSSYLELMQGNDGVSSIGQDAPLTV